jgi:hypothetical protein
MICRFFVWKYTHGPQQYGTPVWKLVDVIMARTEAEAEQAAQLLRDKVEAQQRHLHGRFKAPVPCITLGEPPRYLTEPLPGTEARYRHKRRTQLARPTVPANGQVYVRQAVPESHHLR